MSTKHLTVNNFKVCNYTCSTQMKYFVDLEREVTGKRTLKEFSWASVKSYRSIFSNQSNISLSSDEHSSEFQPNQSKFFPIQRSHAAKSTPPNSRSTDKSYVNSEDLSREFLSTFREQFRHVSDYQQPILTSFVPIHISSPSVDSSTSSLIIRPKKPISQARSFFHKVRGIHSTTKGVLNSKSDTLILELKKVK
ncbi:hypothetical protein CAAN1_04S01662 [[Candida] anglica]|uniref:Uncharacterized protein n=1 Tax=[Candida] anglica TaxID=148631 RepID=A0ABP0EAC4_9ASCO